MPRKNRHRVELERIARALPKANALKAYELLRRAFLIFAASGDVDRAEAVVRIVYAPGRPPPSKVVYALGTGDMDGFLRAAGRGDLTRGVPHGSGQYGPLLAPDADLETRVAYWASEVRRRVTLDAYSHLPPPNAPWQQLEGRELWQAAQRLARPESDGAPSDHEPEALDALTKYLCSWASRPGDPGAGFGAELVLGLDLALRHGEGRLPSWLPALATHLFSSLPEALCTPSVARAIAGGALRDFIGLSEEDRSASLEALAAAVAGGPAAAAPPMARPGKPVKREVGCDSSQFHIEHTQSKQSAPYFQDDRESAQGMSIFADRVGVATPRETSTCKVEIAVAPEPPELTPDAVQAVAFPFDVHSALVLRGVASTEADEEPFEVPTGAYDVLVVFRRRGGKAKPRSGLRTFDVTVSFCPRGSLAAPRCLKLEEGQPVSTIFVQ